MKDHLDLRAAAHTNIYYDSWATVLEKTDRILTRRDVRVSFRSVGENKPAGWSDGSSIVLNSTRLFRNHPTSTEDWIRGLKAVNYHELCHVMFTPRESDAMMSLLRSSAAEAGLSYTELFKFFNILEDARIENLFVGLYPPAAKFFISMMAQYVILKEKHTDHVLLHGRKYLPAQLRVDAAARWTDVNSRETVGKIIDDYIVVDPISHPVKAVELVLSLAQLLRHSHVFTPDFDLQARSGTNGAFKPMSVQVGSVRKSEFDKAVEAVEKMIEKAAEEDRSAQPNQSGVDAVRAAEEIAEEVNNDPAMQGEIREAKKAARAISRLPGEGRGPEGPMQGTALVPPEYKVARRKIARQLKRLATDVEPEMMFRQHHGRLDLRRFLRAKPNERDLFKVYDQGREEEIGVECVILCDRSGSMNSVVAEVSATLWALKGGLQDADVRTTVLLFDTDGYVAYKPDDKVPGGEMQVIVTGGGTQPATTMRMAQTLFAQSSKSNKIMVCLTDGEWSVEATAGYLKRFRDAGVGTWLFQLKGAKAPHHFDHVVGVRQPKDLIKAVVELTVAVQQQIIFQL